MNHVLFIAWRSAGPTNGRWGPVGRLAHGPAGYQFVYTRGATTLEGFRPFPGMPDLDVVYESDSLFPLFANRLLSESRPEYEAFLAWGGFDPADPPDPLAILGVTQGMRQTDSLELFPCPAPDAAGCYVSKFFLHGVRWMPPAALERIARLRPAELLGVMLDISNLYDRNAVAVRTCDRGGRFLIGYVPRYLSQDVRELCTTCEPDFIELKVERVNPHAPLQQRLLCRMSTCWPQGFRPCSGTEYQLLVGEMSSLAVRPQPRERDRR